MKKQRKLILYILFSQLLIMSIKPEKVLAISKDIENNFEQYSSSESTTFSSNVSIDVEKNNSLPSNSESKIANTEKQYNTTISTTSSLDEINNSTSNIKNNTTHEFSNDSNTESSLSKPNDEKKTDEIATKNLFIDSNWQQLNNLEEGSIPISDSGYLHYYFGSHSRIGSSIILPKPSFSLNDNGKEIYAFYRPNNNLNSLRNNHNTIFAYGNSPQDSPTTSNIEDLEPDTGTLKYCKKQDDNGISYLMEYISTSKIGGVIQVDIIMEPLPNKLVRVTTTYTNIGTTTFENAVMGSSYDTKLGTNDKVPVYYIGNNKGIYINDSNGYRLEFRLNNIPNWSVGTFLQENARWIRDFFNEDKTSFSTLNSEGFETRNGSADSIALENVDSAIHLKTQPQTFAPGDTIEMSYDAGILLDDGKPVINLDDYKSEFNLETKQIDISGSWRDSDSESVKIYYKIDEQDPILLGDYANMVSGETYNFSFSLDTTSLSTENHTIKIYGIDSDENISNIEEYILNYIDIGKLTFKEVPKSIDFGTHSISDKVETYWGKHLGNLIVEDTRTTNKGYWRVTLQQTEALNNINKTLSNSLYFVDNSIPTSIQDKTVIVTKKLDLNTKEYNISNDWNDVDKGIKTVVDPSDQIDGTYVGVLEWTLENVVEN